MEQYQKFEILDIKWCQSVQLTELSEADNSDEYYYL